MILSDPDNGAPAVSVRLLSEAMTFDQLLAYSEPKRIARSRTVRGPSLQLDAYRDGVDYIWNCKSTPSTTGLRHRAAISIKRPKDPNTPLERCQCVVDCTCPDLKYRFAWANKQRSAGRVGPNSLNKAHNRAPKITNPGNTPGLCKHLCALRDFLYGAYTSWAWEPTDDTPRKLDKLVRYADKRLIMGDTLAKQQAWREQQAANKAAAEKAEEPSLKGRPQIGREPGNVGELPKPTPVVPPESSSRRASRGPGGVGSRPGRRYGESLLDRTYGMKRDLTQLIEDEAATVAGVPDGDLRTMLRELFSALRRLEAAAEVEGADEMAADEPEDGATKMVPPDAVEIDPSSGADVVPQGELPDPDGSPIDQTAN